MGVYGNMATFVILPFFYSSLWNFQVCVDHVNVLFDLVASFFTPLKMVI